MLFLQNPPAANLAETVLNWWQQQAPDCTLLLLLDNSMLPAEVSQALTLRARFTPLLADSLFLNAGSAGPHSVPCQDPDKARPLLNATLQQLDTQPAFSALLLRPDSGDWPATLEWLALAHSSDGLCQLCRFADSRTLAALLPVLTDAQRGKLATHFAAWGWMDRHGHWSSHPLPVSHTPADNGPFTLDDQQYIQLMEACNADMVWGAMKEPDRAPFTAPTPAELHSWLQQLLQRARRRHVQSQEDMEHFLHLAKIGGDDFDELPELHPTWLALRNSQGSRSLRALCDQWPQSTWQALDNWRSRSPRGAA